MDGSALYIRDMLLTAYYGVTMAVTDMRPYAEWQDKWFVWETAIQNTLPHTRTICYSWHSYVRHLSIKITQKTTNF